MRLFGPLFPAVELVGTTLISIAILGAYLKRLDRGSRCSGPPKVEVQLTFPTTSADDVVVMSANQGTQRFCEKVRLNNLEFQSKYMPVSRPKQVRNKSRT